MTEPEPLTPEQLKAVARWMIWTKLEVHAALEMMVVAASSDDEEMEIWGLNSIREFGKLLKGQMEEPGHRPTINLIIEWMSKL